MQPVQRSRRKGLPTARLRASGVVPEGHQPAATRQVRHVHAYRLPSAAADLRWLLRRKFRISPIGEGACERESDIICLPKGNVIAAAAW